MIAVDFPYCCTGMILAKFGESWVASGGPTRYSHEQIETFIQKEVEYYTNMGYAFVCVTTNNEQRIVNSVLETLGFKSSEWMEKGEHPETQVKLWWLPLK